MNHKLGPKEYSRRREGAIEMARLLKRELHGVKGFDHKIIHDVIEAVLVHHFPEVVR